jgi:hypothetical protein
MAKKKAKKIDINQDIENQIQEIFNAHGITEFVVAYSNGDNVRLGSGTGPTVYLLGLAHLLEDYVKADIKKIV